MPTARKQRHIIGIEAYKFDKLERASSRVVSQAVGEDRASVLGSMLVRKAGESSELWDIG